MDGVTRGTQCTQQGTHIDKGENVENDLMGQ